MAQHKGCDSEAAITVAALKAANMAFICRYGTDGVTNHAKHALTLAEAKAYTAAGIRVVANWETDGNPANTVAEGENHARMALSHFTGCGMPKGERIYFSIDKDVPVDAKDLYFRGLRSVLGVNATDAYGSAGLLAHIRSAGLIHPSPSGWRTMSTGWRGGSTTANTALVQSGQTRIGSIMVDNDLALVDSYGGWFVGGKAPVPVHVPPPFPLARGDWFGVDDGTVHSHSGARAADATNVRKIQAKVGASQDGSYGAGTRAAVIKFQVAHGLAGDGKVGPTTWGRMFP